MYHYVVVALDQATALRIIDVLEDPPQHNKYDNLKRRLKPGVHTNDFAPIHRLRALKLGHASLATVFRPGRLTLQPILWENLDSPVLRYQPITTAVVTDACLNTRWHHGAYTSAVLRESLGLDRVVTVYVELSRPDWFATVQSGRKQVQSRVCTPSLTDIFGLSTGRSTARHRST